MTWNKEELNCETIKQAHERIKDYLNYTPIQTSSIIDSITGKNVYFKCENLQKSGSFKPRGALNALLQKKNCSGIVAHSSGNHGAAVAWACQIKSIPCIIVLPKDTPKAKVDTVKSYNAKVIFCESNPTARVETCEKIAKEHNYCQISPYNDYNVMSGQGTVALEFLQQVPHLDALVVTVSGGGLISGIIKIINNCYIC
jgi:serine racemase